jgi:hypothetical protein
MAAIPSIKELESMSQDQIEIILCSSAKAWATDPADTESRALFYLLNDQTVRQWLTAAPTDRGF